MTEIRCTVQEGAVPSELRDRLVVGLSQVVSEHLGGSADDVSVMFAEIPRGFGFRGFLGGIIFRQGRLVLL